MKEIELDKVLVCNPWIEEVLTDDAKNAIEKAKKRIKIVDL